LVAGLGFSGKTGTVYGFGKNTRTGGFAHSTRPAKQVGVRQLIAFYRIL
jgi:hypothetical protein